LPFHIGTPPFDLSISIAFFSTLAWRALPSWILFSHASQGGSATMQALELDGRSRSSQRPSMAGGKWKSITRSGTARYYIFLPLAPESIAHEQLSHLQV